MGLLRLIHASRLAPLEELLAELKGGAMGSGANFGVARGTAPAASRAFAPPAKNAAPSFATAASAQGTPISPPAGWSNKVAEQESAAPAESRSAATHVSGISPEKVAEIKAAVQAQQKFLGELVEQSSRWELEGAELRIYFSPEKRPFAEMLEGRDSLEKVRSVSSNVLGRTVRVCAKLEAVVAADTPVSRAASGTQKLRSQFERDPMVRSILQRFGGKISEVKRRQEES
jgi:hypothetical protein